VVAVSLFWPPSNIEPFATFINNVTKYVITSSTPENLWPNSTFLLEEPFEVIRELKQQNGGDIGVHGSLELTQSLLARGLIDELRLVVAPVVHGRGRRLFHEGLTARLKLHHCAKSPAGYLLLDYHLEN
jgi:dihydrofolate reductase